MQTIEIRTTQNVTIEYELASLRDRFLALFIDGLTVFSFFIVTIIFLSITLEDEAAMLDTFLLLIGIFILYQLFLETILDGQTFGKKALGIKVVRLDGKEASFSDYLLRAIFHIIDFVFSIGVIAALLISSSAKRQRLGDMTANTAVIKVKFNLQFHLDDILKINTLDDYEPTYPDVKKLSEQDMLLIKNIISRHHKYKNEAHKQVVKDLITTLMEQLDITKRPSDSIGFLKTLIRDYIVLTR